MSEATAELNNSLDRYRQAAATSLIEVSMRTVVAAIPYAGGSILELWNGAMQRRVQERLNTVFEQMRDHLKTVDESKIDKTYFESEEFQTVLTLLLEKLHTTHDQEKLKLFGDILANSGNKDFFALDKELCVRVIRDLNTTDIAALQDQRLLAGVPSVSPGYTSNERSYFSRLSALGLVMEHHYSGYGGGPVEVSVSRQYTLTEFGESLLKFVSDTTAK